MLSDRQSMATVPVKDMRVAREFYETILELELVHNQDDGAITYRTGSSEMLVYLTPNAGMNKATAVTWKLGPDVEAVVAELRSKGVTFEHYELPFTTREGDLHLAGGLKMAWFKDPDGNIHALVGTAP